jgi:hypothetical protein
MLRKVLLTIALLAMFAPAASLAGQPSPEQQMIQEPLVGHSTENDDGMSDSLLAALITGGLGLTAATITAVVSINSRRKDSPKAASRSKKKKS